MARSTSRLSLCLRVSEKVNPLRVRDTFPDLYVFCSVVGTETRRLSEQVLYLHKCLVVTIFSICDIGPSLVSDLLYDENDPRFRHGPLPDGLPFIPLPTPSRVTPTVLRRYVTPLHPTLYPWWCFPRGGRVAPRTRTCYLGLIPDFVPTTSKKKKT